MVVVSVLLYYASKWQHIAFYAMLAVSLSFFPPLLHFLHLVRVFLNLNSNPRSINKDSIKTLIPFGRETCYLVFALNFVICSCKNLDLNLMARENSSDFYSMYSVFFKQLCNLYCWLNKG